MSPLRFPLRNPLSPPRIAPDGWRARAACAGHPDYPAWVWDDHVSPTDDREDPGTRARRIATARAVCASCPVAAECYAAVNPALDSGVRGGIDLRALYEQGGAA